MGITFAKEPDSRQRNPSHQNQKFNLFTNNFVLKLPKWFTMPTIEETINTLKDMGFSEERAKKALNKTGWSGVEAAMDWILNHPEGEDDDEEMNAEVQVAEPKAPLTAEEKAEKLQKLEERRIKKRKEREEREKQEQIEKEKKRV